MLIDIKNGFQYDISNEATWRAFRKVYADEIGCREDAVDAFFDDLYRTLSHSQYVAVRDEFIEEHYRDQVEEKIKEQHKDHIYEAYWEWCDEKGIARDER